MKWPWVSRAKHDERERLWSALSHERNTLTDRILAQQNKMVDMYCEFVTASSFDSLAMGVVPNRTDALLSLHIGAAHILLTPDEARAFASDLINLSYRVPNAPPA